MRNISFALTTDQIRDRSKTVTRRIGWKTLKPGTLLQPVVKAIFARTTRGRLADVEYVKPRVWRVWLINGRKVIKKQTSTMGRAQAIARKWCE